MINNPIETMIEEHKLIGLTESIIERMNLSWESNPSGYKRSVRILLAFLKEYADDYHHRKEEEVLFPQIKNHPDFRLQEIIDEFEDHHATFRDDYERISEELEAENYPQSYNLLSSYLQDLLDHIAAENDELFVLAENLLSEDELETIFFKFKDIDMELGEARKSELEQMIINFAEI